MAKIWGRSSDRKIVLVAFVAAGLLFFHWLGWLAPLENGLARAFSPVMTFFYDSNANLRATYNKAADKRNIVKENEELSAENKALLSENAQLQYLREENKILRKYVNLFDEAKYGYVLARIVARESVAQSTAENNKLIIDKGSKQGVVPGLLIIDQDGMAVAKVVSAKDDIAEAALITSPSCRISVAANKSQKTIGVAQGEAGLTVRIDYIPQTEQVTVGDLLVTSGLEANVPHGYVIGKVIEVKKSNNEIWQSAIVEPKGRLDELRIVSVILPDNKK